MPETIPSNLLESPISGLNLRGGTLATEIGTKPTALVFLRHFGCMFCREMVRDLRRLTEGTPGFPPVLFFYQGTVEEGQVFFGQHWPQARAVSDAPKVFYTAMGLRRATFNQMFGIQVWTCRMRAMSKGNFIGKAVGDPWIMPGVFLVQGPEVIWSHQFKHQGDHPDWSKIPDRVPVAAG
jgi:hypothetical protein